MKDNPTVQFIFDFVMSQVPAAKLPDALIVVVPLLVSYALKPEILTDDLRGKLQGQLLRLLRRLGAQGKDVGTTE